MLVTPIGFEPITCPLGGGCSIQLSHGAVKKSINKTGFSHNSNRLPDFYIIGATYLVRLEMFNLIALQLSLIEYHL